MTIVSFEIAVAGPMALLIAKAYKLHDRLENKARPDRVDEKDAGDAYRIMRTADRRKCLEVARRLIDHPGLGRACFVGLQRLFNLFEASATQGTLLAASHFRAAVPEDVVIEVCAGFVRQMREELAKERES